MTSQSKTNSSAAANLFQSALSSGRISKTALSAINVRDIGDEINAALGVSLDGIKASSFILFTSLIDDSGSIRFVAGNTEAVRAGHNLVLDSLADTKQKRGILAMCTYLNNGLFYPYTQVEKAPRMDTSNYDPNGGTPLYNKSVEVLAAVIAKCQESLDSGVPCRTVTALVTDGANTERGKTAKDVKKIVDSMLKSENHIIAGMGIWDGEVDSNKKPIPGTGTDFEAVFGEMGIRKEWILTPKNSPSEIRKAFQMLSQSSVRASQAAKFSQTAMGGFGAP